jgi:hypothetical protein
MSEEYPKDVGFIFKYRGEFKGDTVSITPVRAMYNALVLHFGMRPYPDGTPANEAEISELFRAYKSFESDTDIHQILISEAVACPVRGYVAYLGEDPLVVSFHDDLEYCIVNAVYELTGHHIPPCTAPQLHQYWNQFQEHAHNRGHNVKVVPATYKVIS